MKKIITSAVLAVFVLSMSAVGAGALVPGDWDVSGSYDINVEYLGTDYLEKLILTQSGTSITGGSLNTIPPAAGSAFTVTSGSVVGSAIEIFADHDPSSLVVHMEGIIDIDGTMSGTWHDEAPGTRTGTWETTDGAATQFTGNHGQYVRMQDDKNTAAQSRVGMPVNSKGHTE